MYLLGYLPSSGRAYLGDKDLNIVSYSLPLAVRCLVMFGMAHKPWVEGALHLYRIPLLKGFDKFA